MLNDSEWNEVDRLLDAALELPSERRVAFIIETCDSDTVREHALRLLAKSEADGGLIAPGGAVDGELGEELARDLDASANLASSLELENIDGFKLVRKLGEGGMGEVWQADQLEPVRRRVAIKLIKLGMDTKEVVSRFQSERQALAMMNHPSIARVYNAGATTRGRPYFVMEYVAGIAITEYCDHNRLTTRERLELFAQVCEGVQHAHQKGIIHRDLKPSNVLVTVEDGERVPKIIDFGVARATDQHAREGTFLTELGQLVGTPEYMSPEQAGAQHLDIDTRTDVYSLGVLLYELLVGALPFDTEDLRKLGLGELRERICNDDPPKPSTRLSTQGADFSRAAQRRNTDPTALARYLRGDLDWIVMCALEKDPARRYGSPVDLAADILRHLRYEPVQAGAPSAFYRMQKLVRRHRVAFGFGLLVAIVLVSATAISSWQAVRATRAERTANDDRQRAVLAEESARTEAEHARQAEAESKIQARRASEAEKTARADAQRALTAEASAREEARRATLAEARAIEEAARASTAESEAQREAASARRVTDFVVELFDVANPESTSGPADAFQVVETAGARIQSELADEPLVRARLLITIAKIFSRLDRHDRAQPMLETALAIREREYGPSSLEVGEVIDGIAYLREERGDLRGAQVMLRRALETYRAQGADEERRVADVLGRLSYIALDQGDYPNSEELQLEALEIRERLLGPRHGDVSNSLNGLGTIYARTGRKLEARESLEQALSIREEVHGGRHGTIGVTLTSLSGVLADLGESAEAERAIRRALDIYEVIYGPNHSFVGIALFNLSNILGKQGRLDESYEALQRAMEIRERVFGPNHVEVGEVCKNLGQGAMLLGKYDEAEEYFARSLDIDMTSLGPNHLSMTWNYNALGNLSIRRDQVDEAEEYFQRAWDTCVGAVGEWHPDGARALRGLAKVAILRENYGMAEEHLGRSTEIIERTMGEGTPALIGTFDVMGKMYLDQERFEEARVAYERSRAITESKLRKDHPGLTRPLVGLAQVAHAQARDTDAEELLRAALVITTKAHGPDHLDIAMTERVLAAVLDATGRKDQALRSLERALAICEATLEEGHPRIEKTRGAMADLRSSMEE